MTGEWETDWGKCPVEGWVWIADSDGQVLMLLGGVAKAERSRQFDEVVDAKYAYQYIAYQVAEPPEHPTIDEIHDAADDWYGRTF